MKRLLIALGCLTVPVSLFPVPGLSAQKRAITIDDYLALKSVGNPQLSRDGKSIGATTTSRPTRASGPVSCGGTGTTGAPASASTCSPSPSPTAAPGT